MLPGSDYRFEFLNDEVLVLDSGAGVVHRLTGEAAEGVRLAGDEVSRRRAIKMALATGIGVATLALPTAAAAASGPSGVTGSGGTGGTGPAAPVSLTVTTAMTSATALTATLSVGALESGHTYTYSVDGGGENVMASATVTTSSLTFASHTITVNKKLGGTVVSTATKTLTTSTASVSSSSAYSSSVLYGQGVRAVYASLIGGRGGRGGNDTFGWPFASTSNGGNPGSARDITATVPIATTGTLTVNVGTGGSNGADMSGGSGGDGGAGGTNALAGYDGGAGGNAGTSAYSGGGGGGGAATVLTYNDGSTDTVQIVVPGSGGGGGAAWASNGGGASDTHSAVLGGGTSGGAGASRGNSDTGGHGGGGGGDIGGAGGSGTGAPGVGGARGRYGGTGSYTELSGGTVSRSIGQNGEASLKFVTVA